MFVGGDKIENQRAPPRHEPPHQVAQNPARPARSGLGPL
nr:MAG TPA: hypothetical protein [Caudoviricetes sp.]